MKAAVFLNQRRACESNFHHNVVMQDVTQILSRIESGDSAASAELLPLVYDELRRLAAVRLSREKPGQTLQATALVHEAYLRIAGGEKSNGWSGRGHFFGAAAEAMRRIMVERARHRKAAKHGGEFERVEFSESDLLDAHAPEKILELNDAIDALAAEDAEAAELVKLRVFADFSVDEAGKMLGFSRTTAYRHWSYARAWLKDYMEAGA
ncbi:ECF-type sigma factor [Novipirellula artificiosorum]|uniref:ECF sigma factor n=1 Tax=Novipirellula artificiosorum TaxID=2528016 RepID=A0A5C6CXZ4_9BACT|nr:ECF-type sigma factor [Novipirellula artificiosorum]TWU28785.1 ECF sigma factor [Novipirellula artificiosorum]